MTRLGNLWRYFRRQGLVSALEAITDRCIYRSRQCVVFGGSLAGPPAAAHLGEVVFRLATASDLDHLDELERYGRGSIQRMHVKEDTDWLFVACQSDRIVATRRLSRVVRDPLVSRVIQLRQRQVWTADNFCLPEYRNQGIGRHLGLFADRVLASRDYSEFLGAVTASNAAALSMSLQKGSEPLYYVSYHRLFFYERLVVSKDIPRAISGGHDDPSR